MSTVVAPALSITGPTNPVVVFLTVLGQCFSAMALYSEEHPMRQTTTARLLNTLHRVLGDGTTLRLSFLDNEVVSGARPLSELRGWEWCQRLSAVGIQRLEITSYPVPTTEHLNAMLVAMRDRLATPDAAVTQWSNGPIRFGPLSIAGTRLDGSVLVNSVVDALSMTGLGAECSAVDYIHAEVMAGRDIPMAEVEAIVHSLAVTIRREQEVILPLLDIREFDEYTTSHSCNVSMLSIGLAEELGLSDSESRAIGTAALLHDIGKVKVPKEVLTKPGRLSDDERKLIETHPVEGARILSARGLGNGLAATVAYEHHIWFNGNGGYPRLGYPRSTHYASRIVHVCDIYDALCSKRPYRDAWPRAKALDLLTSLAGVEVDPSVCAAFVRMCNAATEMRQQVGDQNRGPVDAPSSAPADETPDATPGAPIAVAV
jgi:putative nucleotidyltransferase with HDIG domain